MTEISQTEFNKLLNRVTEAEEGLQRLEYTLDRCGIHLGSNMSFKGSNYMLNANMFQQWETGSSRPLTPADKYVKIENGTLNIYGGGINLNTSTGADGVIIDADGITLDAPTDYSGASALKWMSGTTLVSKMYGNNGSTDSYLAISAESLAGKTTEVQVMAFSPTTKYAEASLLASSNSHNLELQLWANDDDGYWNKFIIRRYAHSVYTTLFEIDSITNSITYPGNLTPYRNSTTYTGYIYVPCNPPLTSTSWDGDTKISTDTAQLDLSALFSVPANIKAVEIYSRCTGVGTQSGRYYNIRTTYNNSATTCLGAVAPTADYYGEAGMVNCDANGDIGFATNAASGTGLQMTITITGYYI